jgi:hypothetical protein
MCEKRNKQEENWVLQHELNRSVSGLALNATDGIPVSEARRRRCRSEV